MNIFYFIGSTIVIFYNIKGEIILKIKGKLRIFVTYVFGASFASILIIFGVLLLNSICLILWIIVLIQGKFHVSNSMQSFQPQENLFECVLYTMLSFSYGMYFINI